MAPQNPTRKPVAEESTACPMCGKVFANVYDAGICSVRHGKTIPEARAAIVKLCEENPEFAHNVRKHMRWIEGDEHHAHSHATLFEDLFKKLTPMFSEGDASPRDVWVIAGAVMFQLLTDAVGKLPPGASDDFLDDIHTEITCLQSNLPDSLRQTLDVRVVEPVKPGQAN